MASETCVKEYLACWFQLGKAVTINGSSARLRPQSICQGDRYSPDFERCWQEQILPNRDRCILSGTSQTIGELLSPHWEMQSCPRCMLPSPQRECGMPPATCPCSDLPNWPHLDLPLPRVPASSQMQLGRIRDRLDRQS